MNFYVFIYLAATDAKSNESWQLQYACYRYLMSLPYIFWEKALGTRLMMDLMGGGVWTNILFLLPRFEGHNQIAIHCSMLR